MSIKWNVLEGIDSVVLQDPHDMVKAILLESQFPSDVTAHPLLTIPIAVLPEYDGVSETVKNFHSADSVKR